MRAKSNGRCTSCGARVILYNRVCHVCQSVNLVQRECDLCKQPIKLGADITWDRRGNKWEAHTECWLNSSPEARERVIRKQQQEQNTVKEFERKLNPPSSEIDNVPKNTSKTLTVATSFGVWQEFDKQFVKEIELPEVTPVPETPFDTDILIEEDEDEKEDFQFVEIKTKTPQLCQTFYDSVYLLIQARVHFYIYGPAGCGKSYIVEQAAHHYSLSFSSISLNVQTMPSTLLGYKDINGVYQSTDFRRIYEHGGVFLIDEMDNASGNLLTTLNSALANRFLQFPDGFIRMHADCIVVATGNTTGRGKTAQYISRQTLDAATLDRFCYLSHTYDEKLELNLALGTNHYEQQTKGKVEFVPCVEASERERWAKKIQKIRSNAARHGLQVVISYRPVVTGCKLLHHFEHASLLEMLVLKGVDADTKHKLMEGVY